MVCKLACSVRMNQRLSSRKIEECKVTLSRDGLNSCALVQGNKISSKFNVYRKHCLVNDSCSFGQFQ